jgi:hypothetical protein
VESLLEAFSHRNYEHARGVGGRSLLGPLRLAATAQVLKVHSDEKVLIRAVLRFATAFGAARLMQRASAVALAAHPAF